MAKTSSQPKTSPATRLPLLSPGVVIAILAVVVIIFYYPLLFGGKFLWEDFVEQEFPFRTLATSSLASGHLPGWNPYVFCGMPFMADIQVAFWYPMNLVQALFVSDGHLSPIIMQWFIVLHYLVAAVGMYYLVRTIFKTDQWSAMLAAIAFSLCGFMTGQTMHQMIVYQLAIFPWVVLLFLKGSDSWKYSLGAGLLLGAMYLAGHPQTTLFLTFFLALLAIYELVYRLRNKDQGEVSVFTVVRMLIPAVIAIGIFAIQFLPSQELASLSRRDTITFQNSVEGSLTFGHLLTLILPRLFGVTDAMREAKVPYWNGAFYLSWETMCYIGIMPLVLAVVAAFGNWKKKYVPFFAAMSLFALLFALGDHFPLYKIFFSLPLFDKLRTPARMMMVFSFSMTALGGVGLAAILKNGISEQTKKALFGILGVVTLVWVMGAMKLFSPQSFMVGAPAEASEAVSWATSLAAFPVLVTLLIGLMVAFKKINGIGLAISVIAITTIELFVYGTGLNATTKDPREAYREQPQLVDMLKQDQEKEFSRARIRGANGMLLKRNQGAYDRIQLLEGYNPLVLQRNAPQCANPEITADLLNIKWSIMSNANGTGFGQRTTYLPRVKMYYKTVVKPDEEAKAMLRTDSLFDVRNVILLEEQPSLPVTNIDANSQATISHYGTDEIETTVKTSENGILFFSEIYYPAWHAYLDGKEVKLYRAFTALRAVEVPKGDHTVVLKYESAAFHTGSLITLITLGATVLGLVFCSLGKKREQA